MSEVHEGIKEADNAMLVQIVMDAFRRTIVHYGACFAEVAHHVGMDGKGNGH